jgi:ribosomal protein L18E
MANIPKKVLERLVAGIKQYQPILTGALAKDVNEADTVTIVGRAKWALSGRRLP